MNLVAIIPAANLISANEALETQGFGSSNFAVVSYSSGRATHAALHAWHDAAFEAAVTVLPNVAYDIGEGDPITRTRVLIEAQGAKVTFQGARYISLINGNVWSPTAYPAGWQVQP